MTWKLRRTGIPTGELRRHLPRRPVTRGNKRAAVVSHYAVATLADWFARVSDERLEQAKRFSRRHYRSAVRAQGCSGARTCRALSSAGNRSAPSEYEAPVALRMQHQGFLLSRESSRHGS